MKNCLRCRKEAVEGYSFCAHCLKTVAQPLEPSPYLSAQINLNPRKNRRVLQSPAPKNEEKKRSCLVTYVIILSILCILFAAGCLWFSRDLWRNYLL